MKATISKPIIEIKSSDFQNLLSKSISINGDDVRDLGFKAEYKNYYLMFGGNETTIEVEEFLKNVRGEWLSIEFNSTHTDSMYDVIVGKIKEIEKGSKVEELEYQRPDTLFNDCY